MLASQAWASQRKRERERYERGARKARRKFRGFRAPFRVSRGPIFCIDVRRAWPAGVPILEAEIDQLVYGLAEEEIRVADYGKMCAVA